MRIGGEGVSVNMIEGPGPSSVATRVMGTGLLVNLGMDAWREREGRSDLADSGRLIWLGLGGVLSGSLRDPGLLDVIDEVLPGMALEVGVLGRAGSSGAEAVAVDSLRILGICSGILICFSPVDFLDGGGPLMESPWLLRRRICPNCASPGEASDSKSSISPSLAALSNASSSESVSLSDSLLESSLALP